MTVPERIIAVQEHNLELRRCVGEYGFLGAMVRGQTGGRWLDDPVNEPVLSALEELQTLLCALRSARSCPADAEKVAWSNATVVLGLEAGHGA